MVTRHLAAPQLAAVPHPLGVGGEAALQGAYHRTLRVDVDIGHGCEIEVDAHLDEHLCGHGGVVAQAVVVHGTEALGRGQALETIAGAEAAHVAALLVDAHKEVGTDGSQLAAEFAQLVGALYVAASCAGRHVVIEQYHRANAVLLQVTDHVVGRVNSRAAKADEEHLADVVVEGIHGFGSRQRVGGTGSGGMLGTGGQTQQGSQGEKYLHCSKGIRLAILRPRVISSAYSRLSPTATPRAKVVTRTP